MKKNQLTVNDQRRNFLARFAGAMGISMLAVPGTLQASVTGNPAPADNEWLSKLTGKHKMVFDVTQPHGIFPFAWPKIFLLTNQATGSPENELNAVVVLRHNAFPYALKDHLWEKYKLGEGFGIDDHRTSKPAVRNPFWQPKEGEFKVPGVGPVNIGINELQGSGVIFCVCNMAITVNAFGLAQKMKLDGEAVKKDIIEGLLPGVNLVPSGVWAVGRAQEHGSAYCFAS